MIVCMFVSFFKNVSHYCFMRWPADVRQTQTADLQTGKVNEGNIVLKCFNRFPNPKL